VGHSGLTRACPVGDNPRRSDKNILAWLHSRPQQGSVMLKTKSPTESKLPPACRGARRYTLASAGSGAVSHDQGDPPQMVHPRFDKQHVFRSSRVRSGVAAILIAASLCAGCARDGHQQQSCAPRVEALPASHLSTLLGVIPRTSARAAEWGFHELATLLPFVARGGLELHVLYTQDGDDRGEGGGDGGPPQVLLIEAPDFPRFQVARPPSAPPEPTSLTAHLYCERLGAWQDRAERALRAEASRRTAALRAWARSVVARLIAIAGKPIPDTSGPEADVQADAGASIFAVAQVAEVSPRPTILFLGGLTSLTPPSQHFPVPAHIIALVRSSNPDRVLRAEAAWSRWVAGAGGSFKAMSADDAPALIAHVLAGGQR
jgi:hypothetical protein